VCSLCSPCKISGGLEVGGLPSLRDVVRRTVLRSEAYLPGVSKKLKTCFVFKKRMYSLVRYTKTLNPYM
jgi:hypothetical protein